MKEGGVSMILQPVNGPLIVQSMMTHDFDAYLGTWAGGSAPDDYNQIWSTENWANGGGNYVGFGDDASDKLIEQIRHTMDTTARYPLCRQFQQMVYDEQPYIFLYSTYRKVIIHKRWGNCIMTFDRPGYVLNNLMLQNGTIAKAGFSF